MPSLAKNHANPSGGEDPKDEVFSAGSESPGAEPSATTVAAQMEELTRQLEALERLAPQLESVQRQAENLAATQRRADVRLGHAAETAERLQSKMDQISDSVELALSLRKDLTRFTELVPDTNDRLQKLEDLAARVATQVETLEARRDAIAQNQAAAEEIARRLEELEDHAEDMQQLDAKVMERAAEIRSHQVQLDAQDQATLEELAAIRAAVRKSLERAERSHQEFDSVQERMTAVDAGLANLESQIAPIQESRQVLVETQSKAEELAEQLQKVAEDCSGLDALETRVAEVQSRHADVMSQSDRIAERQEEIADGMQSAVDRLASIRESVDENVERSADTERRLDQASREIAELQGVLGDWEGRFQSLNESWYAITEMQNQAKNLAAQLGVIAEESGRLEKEVEKIDQVRGDLRQLDAAVTGVEQRVVRIENVRTDVDAMSRDLADLRRKSEAITEAMKHAREAQNEISAMRDEQAETRRWIENVQESVGDLQRRTEDVVGMKTLVESVRQDTEEVRSAVSTIDSRREFLEELDKRLGELEALGARLAEGAPSLRSHLEGTKGVHGGWHFSPSFAVDGSTWEFGLQVRVAGRWKRGIALWLGPIRWFIGWERRIGTEAVAAESPAEGAVPADLEALP